MDKTQFIPILADMRRFTLNFCAVLLLATTNVWADDVELDENGLLNVGNGGILTLNSGNLVGLEPAGIVINRGGVLTIDGGTEIYLKGGADLDLIFDISTKGTLRLITSDLTLGGTVPSNGMIYSGEMVEDADIEGVMKPKFHTLFYLDGGTIEIALGGNPLENTADVSMVDFVFGGDGGTIRVENGLKFESGNLYQHTQNQKGEGITKTGEGTWRINVVTMGTETFDLREGVVDILNSASIGTLNVGNLEDNSTGTANFFGNNLTIGTLNLESGTVNFFKNATIATLNSSVGTTLSGLQVIKHSEPNEELEDIEIKRSHLTLSKGGKIEGTLEEIGTLTLTGGNLAFEGGSHTLEKLGIARNATMNLKSGTSIQLLSEDAQSSYDDLIVEGTLKVSSAFGTGIYKGNLETLELGDVYVAVAGSTDSVGNVIGGIVEINKSDSESETPEVLMADTLHTRVFGIGQIIVDSGVTFQSGTVQFGTGGQSNISGAHILVSGGGTYQAAEVDIGTGYFIVSGEGTTMEFLKTVKAGTLIGGNKTSIIANGNATFETINLEGDYDAQLNNLAIQKGGRVTGHITNIQELTLGGDLVLAVDSTDTPTISAQEWINDPKTTIRIATGTASGIYQNVLQVTDSESRGELLARLLSGTTALYQPHWMENGTALDLQLSVLTMNEYIKNQWGKHGKNIENIGRLIEESSMRKPELRDRLEGLSDAQLRNMVRRAMAGELASNAARFSVQQSANSVFGHLGGVSPPVQDSTRGQVREGFSAWLNPFGQAEYAKKDGNTFDGYNMSRYGFHLGGDLEIYKHAVAGVFFGYTSPYVKSDLGRISANDYSAGIYVRMPIETFILNGMAGFGVQDYSYEYQSSNSHFRGSSLFANIELSRPIPVSAFKLMPLITPLVAMDFQTVTMQDFIVRDPTLGGVVVTPGDLDSIALRVGLLGKAGRFHSRLQYMRQIVGDDFVSSQTSLSSSGLAAATRVRGTQWGKDWLNVGVGGELLTTRNWRIFADYDFDLGKQTTSHLGSLTSVFKW